APQGLLKANGARGVRHPPSGEAANDTLTEMAGICRTALTLAIGLSVAAMPLAADWCAISCDGLRPAASAAAASACHRTSSSAVRVGAPLRNCGHDHHVDIATSTANRLDASRPNGAAPVSFAPEEPAVIRLASMGDRAGPDSRPSGSCR